MSLTTGFDQSDMMMPLNHLPRLLDKNLLVIDIVHHKYLTAELIQSIAYFIVPDLEGKLSLELLDNR